MTSCVVLTHNDERTIEQTLESLAWCDEIVVVDDESTDRTLSLVKRFNAILLHRKLNGDFAAQRNAGLHLAKGPWVLFVDADEVVSPALAVEIQNIVASPISLRRASGQANLPSARLREGQSQTSAPVGYYLKRRDYVFSTWLRHGETSRVRLLRLARQDAGVWVRPVHEVWDVKGQTAILTEPLLHFSHPNVTQFLDDINEYSTLNARYLYARKTHVFWWQIVAYPMAKFLVNYIWFLGFLDGTAGIVTALMMSFHSFLTRGKLWQLWHPGNHDTSH